MNSSSAQRSGGITPEGRVVAVTGGAHGIGAALALRAAELGAAAVAIIDVDTAAASEMATSIRESGTQAVSFGCDITDLGAMDALVSDLVEQVGVPAMVFANAGVNPAPRRLFSADVNDLRWALEVNVIGTWATLRAFGRVMAKEPTPGWLVATASEHAVGVPFSGNSAYTASKHAVLGLCDAVRGELPEQLGIGVLIPGLVATDLWRGVRLRPDEFGGPVEPAESGRSFMARGMPAATVAARAFDGIAAGQFIVASHPHVERYASARSADVDMAFDALRFRTDDEKSYDVTELLRQRAE